MTDICNPRPWGKAQNRPLKGEKIKSILLLSTLCSFFPLRDTPDLNTKVTRMTSVIYSPTEARTDTTKNENKHHNPVFLNTNNRDSYPYASPERPRTTPSGIYQRWSTTGPLGAAMRLMASCQPPKDITRPKQPRQPKQNPDALNDIYPHPPNDCIPDSTKAGKIENYGRHNTPYGGAVREPRDLVCPKYLPELPTLSTGTNKKKMFHGTKANNPLPTAPLPTDT